VPGPSETLHPGSRHYALLRSAPAGMTPCDSRWTLSSLASALDRAVAARNCGPRQLASGTIHAGI